MAVRRARHGKSLLTLGAGAVTVSMAGCPFVAANLIALPPQPAPQCSPTDDPSLWLIGSATGGNPLTLTLSIQTFSVSGVQFADLFVVDGGTLQNRVFDSGTLSRAASVTLTILPDPDATAVLIRTGASCNGTARSLDVQVDLASFAVTISDAP